jgi:ABC-type uncharacterized transport system substrate-binding protein
MVRVPLFAALLAAIAAPARPADVVVLKSADTPAWRPAVDAFVQKAALRHHVVEIDLRGDRAEAERVFARLKDQNVTIVAVGPFAAQLARERAPDRPLVFCMVQDAAPLGLNRRTRAAGVAFLAPPREQMAAIRMVTPRVLRVGVMYGADNLGPVIRDARASLSLELRLIERELRSGRDVPRALRTLLEGAEAVDALWLPPDPLLLEAETRRYVMSEALKAGKPVYTFSPALLAEGALASVGPGAASIGGLAADLVDRLAAGDTGVHGQILWPAGELSINRRIAGQLGVDVPMGALAKAKHVVN